MIETTHFTSSIECHRLKAHSFPDGVMAAHEQLHALLPHSPGRKYYGISRLEENGRIAYWAAAERLAGEKISQDNADTFIIPAGVYTSIDIKNFRANVPSIGHSFQQLLQDPQLDPEGFCLEWYYNDTDVQCLVKLKD